MSCVRKRGNSWNAQVRVSGWRSFTKSFNKKTDALSWSLRLENQLKKHFTSRRKYPEPKIILSNETIR